MIRHFHPHPETDRATELDPSTFDHPEEWQREPRDGRWMIAALIGGALIWAGVIWGAIAIFK